MSKKEQLTPAEQKKRKTKTRLILKAILLAVLLVVLLGLIWVASGGLEQRGPQEGEEVGGSSQEQPAGTNPDTPQQGDEYNKSMAMQKAEEMAVQYDYDGAIELLKKVDGADQDADITARIAEYESKKSNLVATAPQNVTHVFFHSLVVDPERGFAHPEDSLTAGFCQLSLIHI